MVMHVVCPKCGHDGILYLRKVKGYCYITIRHSDGRECSLGAARIENLVELQEVLIEAFKKKLRDELVKVFMRKFE